MELWQLWLLFVVPKMAGFIQFFSVMLVVIGTFVLIIMGVCKRNANLNEKDKQEISSIFKFLIPFYILACIVGLASALVPSKKDAMLIVGGYYALNIEGISDLPPNVVKATNKFIEEYLDDK